MTKWHYAAANQVLHSESGTRTGEAINVDHRAGTAVYGPYLDLPAGSVSARVVTEGFSQGNAVLELTCGAGAELLAAREVDLASLATNGLQIDARIDRDVEACEVRLRSVKPITVTIKAVEIDLVRANLGEPPAPDRPVGHESGKTYRQKLENGFLARYLGDDDVLEVGFKGYWGGTVPIVPQAIGVDVGYPGYDGVTLPFKDQSFGAIYSSHCFEHITEYQQVLRDWYRLLKPGGYLIIVVPHQHLFEKRLVLPSRANADHKRFFTPESLLHDIAETYPLNSYRVRHLAENDEGFNYQDPPLAHSSGMYEIELVIQKIARPYWNLDDGSVRPYSAAEFKTTSGRSDLWQIDVDLTRSSGCVIFGPYMALRPADYRVEFQFDPIDLPNGLQGGEMVFDVAYNTDRIAAAYLGGDAGAARLARGRVTIDFTHPGGAFPFEFRVHAPSVPLAAMMHFRGAVLRYAADAHTGDLR